uniref:Uncharacterized protein n=1 Tax=Neogobius melanostomus TaxID=47308 RepID=A0A8C6UEB3_9GOBI
DRRHKCDGNVHGETALSAACTYGDAHVRARMVRYLLEQGADPNMADTAGRTALMHAVHGRAGVHVISLLLKHGADPALKDYSGEKRVSACPLLLSDMKDLYYKHKLRCHWQRSLFFSEVFYQKIMTSRTLGNHIQVNGAFYL